MVLRNSKYPPNFCFEDVNSQYFSSISPKPPISVLFNQLLIEYAFQNLYAFRMNVCNNVETLWLFDFDFSFEAYFSNLLYISKKVPMI